MSASVFTVGIYTLGCKVNQYESEAIAEAVEKKGFSVISPSRVCDLYVINTCTVTAESDRKARQFIRRAVHKNPNAFVLVTGCMAQVAPQEIAVIEGVDFVCGNVNKLSVVDAACRLVANGKKPSMPEIAVSSLEDAGFEPMEISRFERTRAYIKIEDGCESHCTYCTIPAARGRIRSKDPFDVLREVEALTRGGCREIVLTGIETGSYGKDLDSWTLADLLCRIDAIPGVGRVRLGSLDPSIICPAFVERIKGLRSLAPHFHLSMQSGSDRILAAMKRKYNTKIARRGIALLREALPDVQFTTDMIVGFPGETEEDFAETLDFAREIGFLMIHVFPYSQRKGTAAATMPGQIPQQVKHERVAILQQVADEARARVLDGLIGKKEQILVEGVSAGVAKGHTASFVEVEVPVDAAEPASFLEVRLTSHDGTQAYAELLD